VRVKQFKLIYKKCVTVYIWMHIHAIKVVSPHLLAHFLLPATEKNNSSYIIYKKMWCLLKNSLAVKLGSSTNWPELLLLKFLSSTYTITAISWPPLWFHNFFHTGHFWKGPPFFLNPGCFCADIYLYHRHEWFTWYSIMHTGLRARAYLYQLGKAWVPVA